MAQIVPAILEHTKEAFLQKLSLVSKIPGVERIQVDFGDGEFVAAKLLSVDEMSNLNPAIHWEAHLMVKAPKDFLDYQICGFKTLIVHYEAYASAVDVKQTLAEIKKMGFKAGIAINPETPVKVLVTMEADQYLIMGVVPGKQGQSFIQGTTDRIAELRKLKPNAIIEVDGGIKMDNVKQVADAGADLIIAGSAIVGQENPAEAFEKLKQMANQ